MMMIEPDGGKKRGNAVIQAPNALSQSDPLTQHSPRPVRLFISTGEVSGDLQGSLLVQALQRQAAKRGLTLELLAMGGDRMAAAGAKLLARTSAIGSMGIFESLPFVLPTLRVQRQAKQYLQQYPPDLIVLIDYMGPNLAFCEYFPERLSRCADRLLHRAARVGVGRSMVMGCQALSI
jgi:lipid-A-disaccharide synthase